MAMQVAPVHRESSSSGSITKHLTDNGKYVRYTAEQVEALERVYAECPKPSSLRRQQLIRECPILADIEPKQIKVWFQNRRCREKQRKESSRLQIVNRKLTAMNKLLMEENDRLQKQVSQLVCENGFMQQQLQTVTTDARCESVVATPQHSLRDANNPAGLLSIAEETLSEFLSKATGTAVEWVQMPGMKPGPDSIGIFSISQSCSGVAARACGLIAEILKDRPSWFRDCRNLEVFTMFPAGNGGTIELVYSQIYAPTTLAPAQDMWTLRYTTSLDNGSLVVCERSLSGSGAGPNAAAAAQFVRAEMLPSGYLIRPCEEGGSIIHVVDHLNLQAWSVPEVLRPLYESSKALAQKMTIAALRYVRQIAHETSGEAVYVNSTKNLIGSNNPAHSHSFLGGIICAKASMLLQNVVPAVLICFLREHRAEWADFSVDAYSAALWKAGSYAYPGMRPMRFTGSQITMPLGHTIEKEELLEVIRLEGHSLAQEDTFVSQDIHLLQICSGIDESAVGACSELIFAPIDEMFPDDAPLLPSGFRIIPLESKTFPFHWLNWTRYSFTKYVASKLCLLKALLEVEWHFFNKPVLLYRRIQFDKSHSGSNINGPAINHATVDGSSCHSLRSVLTIAFQFPFESNMQDSVATMARQYVRSVISSVQRVAMAVSPSGLSPVLGPKLSAGSPEALTLAHWICQSYRQCSTTEETIQSSVSEITSEIFHSLPVFIFANQAGLDMLETTLVALQDITLDKIFDESGRKALYTEFAKLMQQASFTWKYGFACLPAGICMSTMGRNASYEQAAAWKVLSAEENAVHCIAFSFVNWSFL
uniref:Homeobox domain-containing protein n=1 Tax=Salix viminalis TaxID=40686 RepID=A0A6N2KGK0_SALVM